MSQIKPEFVEFIPESLEPGRLYISKRYSTASHLCCCGCGYKVVTPLNPAQWRLIETEDSVSLCPSIGNWSFPCRSHYWIRDGRVDWSHTMTKKQISEIKKQDRLDIHEYVSGSTKKQGILRRFYAGVKRFFAQLGK